MGFGSSSSNVAFSFDFIEGWDDGGSPAGDVLGVDDGLGNGSSSS